MTPEDLLLGMESVLTAPLCDRGVSLSLNGDVEDDHEQLGIRPDKSRLVLILEDATMGAGEDDQETGMTRVAIRAVLQTAMDFQIRKGAGETKERARGQVSTLALSTQVRLLISRVLFPKRTDFDNIFGFRFLSDRRYQADEARNLRSRELRFQCVIALDMPASGNPLNVS
jgi:hypothetical protein